MHKLSFCRILIILVRPLSVHALFDNIEAVANHRYCFTNVLIKWPGSVHDGRIFSNSSLNQQFRDGTIPSFEKGIVQDEPLVTICLLGDPAYPLLPKQFL